MIEAACICGLSEINMLRKITVQERWPKLKDHYEEDYEDELKASKPYQNASENYALIIANTSYAKDPTFASLPRAANDARAIRNFCLRSKVKFEEQNVIMLIDSQRNTIEKALEDIYLKSKQRGREKQEVSVFLYYSGHGASFENAT